MSKNHLVYDHVIIGSSPMMLLQAFELAEESNRVLVIEKNPQLGGAWQTTTIGTSDEVEIASHVIEAFPNVYEYLEKASGVPFATLNAQPIRISRSGRHVAYFNRLMLLAAGVRMFLGLCHSKFNILRGRSIDQNDLINYRNKFRAFLRYQTRYLIFKAKMKGPKNGFVDFIDNMVVRAKSRGVQFMQAEVSGMNHTGKHWDIILDNSDNLKTTNVHTTTSSGLTEVNAGKWELKTQKPANRAALVIDIPKNNIAISQTYVAFWRGKHISRISRIDQRKDGTASDTRFLIEFVSPEALHTSNPDVIVRQHLEIAKILLPQKKFRVLGPVTYKAIQNADQLPAGKLADNFYAYYSNGNLAAGLAYWLHHQKPTHHT